MLGFIFINKKPVEETQTTNFEEIIDETIEEEELKVEAIPIKSEVCNENEKLIESNDDEEECELTLMDDCENEEIAEELEMINEEYLNDSNTEIEKGKIYIRISIPFYKSISLR